MRYSESGSTHRNGTRRDVLRDVVGDGEQHHRAHRGEREPQQLMRWPASGRSRGVRCRILLRGRSRSCDMPRRAGAQHAQTRRTAIDQRPADCAAGRTPARTAADKPSSASSEARLDSANRRYGTAPLEAAPEPRLQQRAGRRQQEVRQADRDREQQRGCAPIGSSSPCGFQPRRGDDRQQASERAEQRHMQQRLPRAAPARVVEVGVGVAGEQHALEEHEAGGPDRGRAAEPRQDLLGDDRLDQEQQERRKEDRRRVRQRGYQGIRSC